MHGCVAFSGRCTMADFLGVAEILDRKVNGEPGSLEALDKRPAIDVI